MKGKMVIAPDWKDRALFAEKQLKHADSDIAKLEAQLAEVRGLPEKFRNQQDRNSYQAGNNHWCAEQLQAAIGEG